MIKWNGLLSSNSIPESIRTRLGGISATEEYKLHNNEMVKEIELACTYTDFMAGHPSSVVADVADDLAPTVTDTDPRDVLHKMQLLQTLLSVMAVSCTWIWSKLVLCSPSWQLIPVHSVQRMRLVPILYKEA